MGRKLRETARVSEGFMLLRTAAVCLGAFEWRYGHLRHFLPCIDGFFIFQQGQMQVRSQFAFGGNCVHQRAERLSACDALTDVDLTEQQPGVFADPLVGLPNLHAPAPKRVPRTGGHDAIAQAEDILA